MNPEIEIRLTEASQFLNGALRTKPSERDRDVWVHKLTSDLMQLDAVTEEGLRARRRELITGIQNVLDQLDHLFDSNKPIVLLSGTQILVRDEYLPSRPQSFYALIED